MAVVPLFTDQDTVTGLYLRREHDALRLTDAERSAGVTPTNFAYPLGDVRRYGALGDGVTNDAPAVQKAINVARETGGTILFPAPPVFYLLTDALDCTVTGAPNSYQWKFLGEGSTGLDNTTISIIFKHTGHGFDLTGAYRLVFENLTIGTDATTFPSTCFLLARNTTGGSAGWHRFVNVKVRGKFGNALYYNYASEDEVIDSCDWINEASGATKTCVWTSTNVFSLTSTFTTIATGSQSSIDHQVFGGQLINLSGHASSDVFYLDAIESLKVYGPWMYCASNSSDGRALVYVDTTNGPSHLCKLHAVQGERGIATHLQQYGIRFAGSAGVVVNTGWLIDSPYLPARTFAILSDANSTLDNFHIRNVQEETSNGMSVQGIIQNSSVDCQEMLIAVVTPLTTTFIGDPSRWTVTNLSATNHYVDSGTATKTWTPGTAAITFGGGAGARTISNTRAQYSGATLELHTTISPTTSMVCALGTNLTGAPLPAVARSAMVSVYGSTAGFIGGGAVIGANIKLPAINVLVEDVTISVKYFFA